MLQTSAGKLCDEIGRLMIRMEELENAGFLEIRKECVSGTEERTGTKNEEKDLC